MPSPSENKAVDIVLAAFPGSEVLTADNTKPLPVVDKGQSPQAVYKPEDKMSRNVKKPPHRRGLRPGKNQDGMF